VGLARNLIDMGFEILATAGTHAYLDKAGVKVTRVHKVREGRPNIVDRMLDGDIHLVMNTTSGAQAIKDSFDIRRTALVRGIPYYTTLSAAKAAVGAIAELRSGRLAVRSMQEYQQDQGAS
jgi:carbamoyl-phosphate synthase large subunit